MSAGCANLLVIGVAVLCYCIGYHEGMARVSRLRHSARHHAETRRMKKEKGQTALFD